MIFPTWSMGYLISKPKLSEMATQLHSFSVWVRKHRGSLVFPARLFAAVLQSFQVRSGMFSYKERNKQVFAFRKSLVKIVLMFKLFYMQLEQARGVFEERLRDLQSSMRALVVGRCSLLTSIGVLRIL